MNSYLGYSRAMLLQLSAEEMHGSAHGARVFIQLGARASAIKI